MTPITRRAALAAIPAAALVPAIPANGHRSSLDEIDRLIEAHKQAKVVDEQLWGVAADLSEVVEPRLPHCRVQVGRLVGMRDEDGNETWRPIYAYSDEEID